MKWKNRKNMVRRNSAQTLMIGYLRAENFDRGLFIDKNDAIGANRHRNKSSAFSQSPLFAYLEKIGQIG